MESCGAMDGQPISFAASPTEAALAFASDTYKLVVISFDDAPDLPTPDAGKRKGRRRTAVERFQTSGPQRLPTAKARVVDTCRHEDGAHEGMDGDLRCDLFSNALKRMKELVYEFVMYRPLCSSNPWIQASVMSPGLRTGSGLHTSAAPRRARQSFACGTGKSLCVRPCANAQAESTLSIFL